MYTMQEKSLNARPLIVCANKIAFKILYLSIYKTVQCTLFGATRIDNGKGRQR